MNNIPHRGLLLYIHKQLSSHSLDTIDLPNIQVQTVCVTLDQSRLILHNVYIPPELTIADYPALQLTTLMSHHVSVILAGDLNSHHPTWLGRRHHSGTTLVAMATTLNCTIVVPQEPTFVHRDSILDLVITKGLLQHDIRVLREGLSDHWPVLFSTTIVAPSRLPSVARHLSRPRQQALRTTLETIPVPVLPLATSDDINLAVSTLTNIILTSVPALPATTGPRPRQLPWAVRVTLRYYRLLQRRYRLYPGVRLREALQQQRTLYLTLVQEWTARSLCRASQTTSLQRLVNGPKNARPHPLSYPLVMPQHTITDLDEKLETLGHHFQQQFTAFTPAPPLPPAAADIPHLVEEMVTVAEVTSILKQLNPSAAPGIDLLTTSHLLALPEDWLHWVMVIINQCLTVGYFPDIWKTGRLVTIPKQGVAPNDIAAHRPLMISSTLGKILEHAILRKLKTRLGHLIPPWQFGFRDHSSTMLPILGVMAALRRHRGSVNWCIAVFLDFIKAYDKVWHPQLLLKLRPAGTQLHKILTSYLSDRVFRVTYEDRLSCPRPVTAGVPQGGILSPFLFALYLADLPTIPTTDIWGYADDVALTPHSVCSDCWMPFTAGRFSTTWL